MENNVKFELNASEKGWNCTGCGLFVDSIGRPLFGKETWIIKTMSSNWLENKPEFYYCPRCGRRVVSNDG